MTASEVLVSIVTPAYNAEKYITETIESVLNQTYENWELLVIDDGSTDYTAKIVKSFSDPRIILIQQENGGVSSARNRGLDLAKGKYITFLDADDILPPGSLKVRVEYLETNPDVDILDGRAVVKDQELNLDLRIYEPTYKGRLFPRLIRLDSQVFFTCHYMFRSDILGNIRFQEDMTHSEDIFFFLELSSRGNICYDSVPDTVFWYRVGHTSAMSNLDGYEKGYFKLLNKIKKLNGVTLFDQLFLRLKISRILFLTWLRYGNPLRAFKSVIHVFLLKDRDV